MFGYFPTHTFALLDWIFDLENVLWLFNLVDIDFVHYIFTMNEKKTAYRMQRRCSALRNANGENKTDYICQTW